MPSIESTPDFVARIYEKLEENVQVARRRLDRPLSYTEKIFLGHLADPEGESLSPGESYVELHPDRVAMQDATAQCARSPRRGHGAQLAARRGGAVGAAGTVR